MKIDSEMVEVQLLDGIDLSDRSPSKPSNVVQNARLDAEARKKKKIQDLLSESTTSDALTGNLMYFRRFAANTGGLLEHDFRMSIWPTLAENLPMADGFLPKNKWKIDTEIMSAGSSCSDSDFFESARSSFSSTASVNGDLDEDDKDSYDVTETVSTPSIDDLQAHPEWNQVALDVNRTLARFPPNISEDDRFTLQADLTPMIVELLHSDKSFRYYQGFHDVILTILLALDVEKAKRVSQHLVQRSSLRNYLTKSLEESALAELRLVYVILHHCCPQVEKYLRDAELGTLFALSWPITWFSHALHSFDQVVLVFDMFLSSHYLMPIYVSAALVEHRRLEILNCEQEMPPLHHLLNNIPNDIDIQTVLDRATDLFSMYPPGLLQGNYLREYNDMCNREACRSQRQQRQVQVRRHSALTTPLMVVGTAAAGVVAYWLLQQ